MQNENLIYMGIKIGKRKSSRVLKMLRIALLCVCVCDTAQSSDKLVKCMYKYILAIEQQQQQQQKEGKNIRYLHEMIKDLTKRCSHRWIGRSVFRKKAVTFEM